MLSVGGDQESQSAADRGRVEVRHGEREVSGEAHRRSGLRVAESDRFSVECFSGGGSRDGELAGELYGSVVEMSVAEELEGGERQGAEIESCRREVASDVGGGAEEGSENVDESGVDREESRWWEFQHLFRYFSFGFLH